MPRGSKPGERRGGRKAGTVNKSTAIRVLAARQGLAMCERLEQTPLDVILTAMAGGAAAERITDRMLQCAVAAAPYCHPRLSAVAFSPPPDTTQDERRVALARLSYEERKAIEGILIGAGITDRGREINE